MQILRPFNSLDCMALKSALPNPKKLQLEYLSNLLVIKQGITRIQTVNVWNSMISRPGINLFLLPFLHHIKSHCVCRLWRYRDSLLSFTYWIQNLESFCFLLTMIALVDIDDRLWPLQNRGSHSKPIEFG